MSRARYKELVIEAVMALHEDEDENWAVEALADLTADQRRETLHTAHMLVSAVERAQKESGDL